MAQHLAGWQQSVDQATLAAINALADDVLTASGLLRYLVPADKSFLHWGMAGGISLTRAQVVTPSIGVRRMSLEITPRKRGTSEVLTLASPELWIPERPIPLIPTESLELQTAEDGAAATQQTGFVSLGPAQLPPMPDGEIRRIRLTGTTTLTARAWTTVTLTPDVTLEPGTYALVGVTAFSADAVAARVLFQGGGFRPGVPALSGASEGAALDADFSMLTRPPISGYLFGSFTHLTLPQVQYFAIAGNTAQTVFMDVIRTGALTQAP